MPRRQCGNLPDIGSDRRRGERCGKMNRQAGEKKGAVVRFGIVVFPGTNCDRDATTLRECIRPGYRSYLSAQRPRPAELRLHRPPRRLLLRRLPARRRHRPLLARDARRGATSPPPAWSIGICNGFQILLRGRPAARRAAAQRPPAVPLRVGQPAGRERRTRRSQALPARPGPARADRPRRGQLLRRRRDSGASSKPTARSSSATATPDGRRRRRRQPQRLTGQHRRHLQPRRQRLRPDAPPGALLRGRCWAAPTAARRQSIVVIRVGDAGERGAGTLKNVHVETAVVESLSPSLRRVRADRRAPGPRAESGSSWACSAPCGASTAATRTPSRCSGSSPPAGPRVLPGPGRERRRHRHRRRRWRS